MSVKLAVGVFMPGMQNCLTQAPLLMEPGLVPKKSSRPDQSKDLINIQGMGENRDVQWFISIPLQNIAGTAYRWDYWRLRQR